MITKTQCDLICQTNDSFIHKMDIINGKEVHQYSYMICSYNDFEHPLGVESNSELKAFELRGITFVETDNGFDCFPMLHKFFNINQTIGYMYDDVKNKTITQIQDKVDGSLIAFVRVNGETLAKSKFSFVSDQAIDAQKIYNENNSIKKLVDDLLDANQVPLFEYVSFSNRIVVLYDKEELILLQIRDKSNGSYYSANKVADTASYYSIPCAQLHKPSMTIDEMLERKKTTKNCEGWLVGFEDGQMMKIKTDWYFNLHGLISSDGNCSRINMVIAAVLDQKIDDMLSAIPVEYTEIRNHLIEVEGKIVRYINKQVGLVKLNLESDGRLSRKDFAIKHGKSDMFSVMMMNYIESSDESILNGVTKLIAKRTNSLSKATEFYESL